MAERVDEELVIYDELSQTAHSLSQAAVLVWEHCDGERTPAEIADVVGLAPEMVARALAELRACGLLEQPPGYSRREATIKFAKVGGAAFAAPLIYSVAVPSAAAAASARRCDALPCSCTGKPNSNSAQGCATQVCTANTACQSTSTCTCTPVQSGGTWSCTGTCSF